MKIIRKILSLIRVLVSLLLFGLMIAVLGFSVVLAVGWLDHLQLRTTQEMLSSIFGFFISIFMLLNGKRVLQLFDKFAKRLAQ